MTPLGCALVTGALGGIGRPMVTRLRDAGYRVIATDRLDPADQADGYYQFDIAQLVRSAQYRDAVLSRLKELIGQLGLHLLVNNAAVQLLNGTDEILLEEFQETLDTNLLGPFLLLQGLLPELERAGGSVVNISSVHATATKPGFVCYSTSKAGLVGLTRSLAVDLGPRVRVNCVLPAATDTPMLRAGFAGNPQAFRQLAEMHPLGRITHPEEVANAVLYLASPAASAITGAALAIDGGIGGRLHDPV